jgi:hypothetical protein
MNKSIIIDLFIKLLVWENANPKKIGAKDENISIKALIDLSSISAPDAYIDLFQRSSNPISHVAKKSITAQKKVITEDDCDFKISPKSSSPSLADETMLTAVKNNRLPNVS